jgi:hypothetical protein
VAVPGHVTVRVRDRVSVHSNSDLDVSGAHGAKNPSMHARGIIIGQSDPHIGLVLTFHEV